MLGETKAMTPLAIRGVQIALAVAIATAWVAILLH